MSVLKNVARTTEGIVRVGGGRGFLVETRCGCLVITAAHCLPRLPPAHPFSNTEEKTFAKLIGPVGSSKPSIWAECCFVDPVADLAVLGEPDGQVLFAECESYEALVERRPKLAIGSLPSKRLATIGGLPPKRPGLGAWLLALDGRWARCSVVGGPRFVSVEGAPTPSGTSGSPIVTDDGLVVAIVSTGMMNPTLRYGLPAGLLREIRSNRKPNRRNR